mmetsp:Transcript_10636/g.44146  ORF Transcript_10636/g.44146 Transcript_10636/m.44146 type:complete len:129 (+) Transcript_10636:670-1056(+)
MVTRLRVSRLLALASLLSSVFLASAAPVERRELVTVESGLAVDPIGVVRSVTITNGVSFNAFCEFIVPFLDFELPPGVCSNPFDLRGQSEYEDEPEDDYGVVEPQAWQSSRRRGSRASSSRGRSMHRG